MQIIDAHATAYRPRPLGERVGVRGRILGKATAAATPSPALRATSPPGERRR